MLLELSIMGNSFRNKSRKATMQREYYMFWNIGVNFFRGIFVLFEYKIDRQPIKYVCFMRHTFTSSIVWPIIRTHSPWGKCVQTHRIPSRKLGWENRAKTDRNYRKWHMCRIFEQTKTTDCRPARGGVKCCKYMPTDVYSYVRANYRTT